jgi:nucleoside-diphosphate-sugar epimerase
MEAALKAGPQLESLVVTSSVAAVSNSPLPPGYVLTESDFATVNLDRANKERGGDVKTPPGVLYSASKAAAERVVWKFKEEQKVSASNMEMTLAA